MDISGMAAITGGAKRARVSGGFGREGFPFRMKMAVLKLLIISAVSAVLYSGCGIDPETVSNGGIRAAVTIMPEKAFVEAVCGDKAEIGVVVPPGYGPENYEPSPKLMAGLETSQVYFTIGLQTEEAFILPGIRENAGTKVVSLEKAVAARYKDREISPGERDPHIWLSPKRVAVMVEAVAEAMEGIDPANSGYYRENAAAYIARLTELDLRLKEIFAGTANKSFMVFHPAFGYLAEDYGLTMYSLEEEGKEAGARHLQEMTDLAVLKGITTVFYQAETDGRQAEAFADGIGGRAVMLDPLSPDYIDNIIVMAGMIASRQADISTGGTGQ